MNLKKRKMCGAAIVFLFFAAVLIYCAAGRWITRYTALPKNAYEEEWDIVMEIADVKETDKSKETGEDAETADPEDAEQKSPSNLMRHLQEQTAVSDVVVAVIDTGLDYEDFSYKNRVIGDTAITDENGHGTMMAEIIAQNGGDFVKILPIKVTDEEGKTTVADVCRAIREAGEAGADIINLSMNTLNSQKSQLLENTIDQAVSGGAVVVVSAGNKGTDVKNISPANVSGAIVISAVDETGMFAAYSNYGDTVDYSAPGSYQGKTGTSYAAAYYSGVLAMVLSMGLPAEEIDDYLYDYGDEGWDERYGKGVVSLTAFSADNLLEEFFGDEWEEQGESLVLSMGDFRYLTDAKIDAIILQSDLADVGCYLDGLTEEEKEELLSRDTILAQRVSFCEADITGEDAAKAEMLCLTEKEECLYYEKCLAEYERESGLLRTSAVFLKKTGYFNLVIDDRTGSGLSTTYQIHARVCCEYYKLSEASINTGKVDTRVVNEYGDNAYKLTVWSNVSSGAKDTMKLTWRKPYAVFYGDNSSQAGRIFIPNISVTCPAYTLMYTKDTYHPASACAGRTNYFDYTVNNTYTYKSNRDKYHLRKYGMTTSASTQLIKPQLNTSHMNLSDTGRSKSITGSNCTMYIILNNPKVTVTIDPNGEKWGGKTTESKIEVIDGKTYDLGKTTVTNYKASFYGGGDALDAAADTVVVTDKAFSSWSLTYQANGSGAYGSKHSSMSGTVLTAGTIEYDKQSVVSATSGELVRATAVFSGSHTITFPKAPTRQGYSFAGWYTGAASGSGTLACSSANAGKASVTLTADCSFHAEWTKNDYTVSYYSGEDCIATQTYPYRTDIDLSASEEKQDGDGIYFEQKIADGKSIRVKNGEYLLVGWSLTPDGTIISSVNVPADHNTRLYAVWSMPTSGMKEVSVKVQSGGKEACRIIPTEGAAEVNLTLGLRAFLYQADLAIAIEGAELIVTDDGYSYAEDRAGNKTPLLAAAATGNFPVQYTFQYKSYVYNPTTAGWDYLENRDVSDMAEVYPGESYTYLFLEDNIGETPYGYTYDHAEYCGSAVGLPYALEVKNEEAAEGAETVYTVDIFYYPKMCTVTFDANGGTFSKALTGDGFSIEKDGIIASKTVLFGSVIGEFPTAEKGIFYGCTGFYDEKEDGTPASANRVVSGDLMLYAHWETKSGTVRYDAASNLGTVDGSGSIDTFVVYESEIAYDGYAAERECYEFLGWSKEAQNTPENDTVEVLNPSEDVLILEAEAVTLYAQFARTLSIRFHQWSITEEGRSVSGELPVLYNMERAKTVVAPAILPVDGWEPYGWTSDGSCCDSYEIGERTEITVSDDADYYAVYRRIVTVTYDLAIPEEEEDDISFDSTDTAYAYCSSSDGDNLDAEFSVRSGPTREYYTFLYWESQAGEQYEPGDVYESSEDLALTAVWEPKRAIVIYDAATNGGTVDEETQIAVEFDYQSTIPTDSGTYPAKKDGYEFLGWNTDPDAKTGMEKDPDADETLIDNGVLTVYAIFKREVTAFFYQQGKTEAYSLTGSIYNNAISATLHAPAIDAYEGWSPLGWTTEKGASAAVELCSDTDFELAEDICVYALYEKTVTLSYDTGIQSLVLSPQQGIVRHNTSEESDRQDEPACFVAAGMIEQENRSFLYWEDTGGKRNEEGGEILLYEDETLAAVWDMYPKIAAVDRYFTLEQATDPACSYINQETLLDARYVAASDEEDDDASLSVCLVGYLGEEFLALTGSADLLIGFTVEDSFGHTGMTYATVHVVDTAAREEADTKQTRFLTESYYKKDETYVPEEEGGLLSSSAWKSEEAYAGLLSKAMENASAQEPEVRYHTYVTMEEIQEIKTRLLE